MAGDDDFYSILGIPKDASPEDIKKGYKREALKHHPDRNEDKVAAEAKFKKITEAYTVLSDDNKRGHYDRFGTVEEGAGGAPTDINDIFRNMFGGSDPFGGGGNPFESMFGGMFGGGGRPQHQQADVMNCEVTLQEVYEGTTKRFDYEITNICQTCKGVGAMDQKDIIKCMNCQGQGHISQRLGPMFITQSVCPACFGNGTSIKNGRHCGNCTGKKEASYKRQFKMEVPKGIPNKFTHKMDGKGCWNKATNRLNDLIIVFNYVPQPNLHVEEPNLKLDMDIKFEDLICGFTKKINIYGKELVIKSTGYFNPTNPIMFKGKGLPVYKKADKYGDLAIKFTILYDNDDRPKKYLDVFLKIYKKDAVDVTSGDNIMIISQ